MKTTHHHTKLLLLLVTLLLSVNIQAQTGVKQAELIKAFTANNADQLCSALAPDCYVLLPNGSKQHKAKEACPPMQQFFSSTTQKKFTVLHQGGSDSSHFVVGEMITKEAVYRVNVLVKMANGVEQIEQLRIEKK